MRNFGVICSYFPSNNTSLIKLHITVSDLPEQKDDICTHKMWNRRLLCLLCGPFGAQSCEWPICTCAVRNLVVCLFRLRSAVTRILWRFVSMLCQVFIFEFYANINITPTFAADAIQCYRTKCEKIYNLWNKKCWISRVSCWHTKNNSQTLEVELSPMCIAQCPLLFRK